MEPIASSPHFTFVQPTPLCVLEDGGGRLLLDGELSYDRHDPYAVTLVISGPAEPTSWTFARDLLSEGLEEPSGDGDVHVLPAESEDGDGLVLIELVGHQVDVLLAVNRSDVEDFVAMCHEMVPVGGESAYLDLDGALTAFLATEDHDG